MIGVVWMIQSLLYEPLRVEGIFSHHLSSQVLKSQVAPAQCCVASEPGTLAACNPTLQANVRFVISVKCGVLTGSLGHHFASEPLVHHALLLRVMYCRFIRLTDIFSQVKRKTKNLHIYICHCEKWCPVSVCVQG